MMGNCKLINYAGICCEFKIGWLESIFPPRETNEDLVRSVISFWYVVSYEVLQTFWLFQPRIRRFKWVKKEIGKDIVWDIWAFFTMWNKWLASLASPGCALPYDTCSIAEGRDGCVNNLNKSTGCTDGHSCMQFVTMMKCDVNANYFSHQHLNAQKAN